MSIKSDMKTNLSGIEDIYLTKNPEISFFKKNYKRYSNFATEIKKISINNTPRYGETISINVDKVGDLLHKSFIEVSIPLISLKDNIIKSVEYNDKKNSELKNLQTKINTYDTLYNNLKEFATMEIDIYRFATNILLSQNITTTYIKSIILNYSNKYTDREQKIITLENSIVDSVNLLNYFTTLDISKSLDTIQTEINTINNNLIKKLKFYFKRKQYYSSQYDNINTGTIDYCWTKHLGHCFFESFEIEVGGLTVEKYSRDIFHIYNIKNIKKEHVKTYNKMIGNVDELTMFYSIKKNNYILYIPLLFWFTKDSLHSLPLVSMKYSDVIIKLKLAKLQDILFFRDDTTIFNNLMKLEIDVDHSNNMININNNLKYTNYIIDTELDMITYYCTHINMEFLNLKFPNMGTDIKNNILNHVESKELSETDFYSFIREEKNIVSCRYELLGKVAYYDYMYMYSLIMLPTVNFLGEYVYVNSVERDHFASTKLVYMIDTFNENIFDIDNKVLFSGDLDFVNMVKEMLWFFKPNGYNSGKTLYDKKDIFNYNIDEKFLKNFNIYINDMMMLNIPMINSIYYNYTQAYKYNNNILPDGVYMKSFSLNPNDLQPSGGVNFTYLTGKNIKLELLQSFLNNYYNTNINHTNKKLKLVFINKSYNLFIVEKGSGRIIFSN